MMSSIPRLMAVCCLMIAFPIHVVAETPVADGPACTGFGPQAPRDIDNQEGVNSRSFATTSDYKEMNLCNIHFHNNAEHKAKAFSIYAGEGEHGHGGGYQCLMGQSLTEAELAAPVVNHCKGVQPGDTIEVHWVHTSRDINPGPSLGSCLSDACSNPDLRVESPVFTLVNDPSALQFSDFSYAGNQVNGLHQARSLPTTTGQPVEFMGSTTGPKFSEQQCSPMQVAWGVRPQCAKLDINSISDWCEDNVFTANEAHGVRKLVTDPKLLSEID